MKAVDKAIGDGLATEGAVGRIWSVTVGKVVVLGWIKAHVGIPGNEGADAAAKRGAGMDELVKVTPAVRQRTVDQVLRTRKKSRFKRAWGGGLPLGWGRRACTAYTRLRTGRGDIGSWRSRIGEEDDRCRKCGESEAGGEHRVFWCAGIERPKRKFPDEEGEQEWRSWCEVEEWARTKEGGPAIEKWFEEAGG